MASPWTDEQKTIFENMLVDGAFIQSICDALPGRPRAGIEKRARNKDLGFDFRTSSRDGRFYKGVSRRHRRVQDEATLITIAGERVATTTQEPATSESTSNDLSDASIAYNEETSSHQQLRYLYDDVKAMLANSNYPLIECIEVKLGSITLKMSTEDLL